MMKKEFIVKGMSCGHCRQAVEKALNGIQGVRATVTLEPPRASVEFDNGDVELEILQKALSEAGPYTLTEKVRLQCGPA